MGRPRTDPRTELHPGVLVPQRRALGVERAGEFVPLVTEFLAEQAIR